MSHAKFLNKTLLALVISASFSTAALADDPAPSFLQYNKPENGAVTAASPATEVGTQTSPAPMVNTKAPTAPVLNSNAPKAPASEKLSVPAVAPVPTSPAPMVSTPVGAPVISGQKKPEPVLPVPIGNPVAQSPVNSVGQPNFVNGTAAAHLPQAIGPASLEGHPLGLTEKERLDQVEKSRIDSETDVWKARAKQAQAQAEYQEAMKKVREFLTPTNQPIDPRASEAINKLNEIAAKQGFAGIKVFSTYGDPSGVMYADISFNGNPMRVSRGDHIDGWVVSRIGLTDIGIVRKKERKTISITNPINN